MSREAFSYDPQDTRDEPSRRVFRERSSTSADTPNGKTPSPEQRDGYAGIETRSQDSGHDPRNERSRAYYLRDRTYLLRDSQVHSLGEVGKFRVIAVADLAKHAYGGNCELMEKDIRALARQSLLRDSTTEISHKKSLRVVTLTKAGLRVLKNTNQLPENQPVYHGFLKPREVKHDADLYRLYQKEVARIEHAGGKPLRVLLDYELKRCLNHDLALLGVARNDPDRKREVAEKHDLHVVNGKIPVPDLRVEFETPELELRHVDLELATREYRPRVLAAKVAAGFALYSRTEDASRVRRVLDAHGIIAGIRTL